jgi:hypothetical protein
MPSSVGLAPVCLALLLSLSLPCPVCLAEEISCPASGWRVRRLPPLALGLHRRCCCRQLAQRSKGSKPPFRCRARPWPPSRRTMQTSPPKKSTTTLEPSSRPPGQRSLGWSQPCWCCWSSLSGEGGCSGSAAEWSPLLLAPPADELATNRCLQAPLSMLLSVVLRRLLGHVGAGLLPRQVRSLHVLQPACQAGLL